MGIWEKLFGAKKAQENGAIPQTTGATSESLRSAEETTALLLQKVADEVPTLSESEIRHEYARISHMWGSKQLFEGTAVEIRALVLRNLEVLADSPSFESFRVELYEGQRSAQAEALFPKRFIGVRVWRTADRFFVCGNYFFGDVPLPPDLERVGRPPERRDPQGRIQVTVSRDAFGRAIKTMFEYVVKHFSARTFRRDDLPRVSSAFLAQVNRILLGNRRESDPMPVVQAGACSPEQTAQNMILWELSRAQLIIEREDTGATLDIRRKVTIWEPGEPFTVTTKGKMCKIVLV
jgi:hypothetical protein